MDGATLSKGFLVLSGQLISDGYMFLMQTRL